MKKPPRHPDIADAAPMDLRVTVYDEEHLITYLRLLDAEKEQTGGRSRRSCCIRPRTGAGSGEARLR